MKQFDNVEALWQYMLLCPLCKTSDRLVGISVGPDECYSLVEYKKTGYNIVLTSMFKSKPLKCKYEVAHNVDCIYNTYIITTYPIDESEKHYILLLKGNDLYDNFFFYLQSHCKRCINTGVYSADIELSNGTISNIMLEREDIYLLSTEKKYRVSYYHDENKVKIARCWYDNGELQYSKKRFICNLPFEIDFSDVNKASNKIGTLLTFS